MIRRNLLLASLLVLPSVAVAQRGGRVHPDGHTSNDEITPKGPALRVRDLEDASPLKLIIDKRKDLKLNDAQLSQMKDAEKKMKEKTDPQLKAIDSTLHEMRPPVGTPSDEDKVRLRNAREGVSTALGGLNTTYEAAAKEAIALLDPDQQAKATELVTKQRDETAKMIREKLSGGERRGGGEHP